MVQQRDHPREIGTGRDLIVQHRAHAPVERLVVREAPAVGPALAASQVIVRRVDGDAMKVGRDLRVPAIPGQPAVERDEDLLDQVVALGDRADQARDARPYGVRVTTEKARERGAVTLAGRGDQRGVGSLRFPARDHGERWSQSATYPRRLNTASTITPTYAATCGVE